ncbi:toll/interleukin-1 receptor domain-containing protein [Hydrogenophaga sp.]|uniref:toll/interleukin-1 receptor domain-containing protein n=1 Tax=Hydrogenophaga sp. TaxID=1904254 RepID=UPI003AF7176F
MDGIFISYRRDDSAGYAGRLYDRLSAHFGTDQVFMDVEGIELGTDFVTAIEQAVGSCKVLIVVIGDEWLSTTDAAGRRRLDDPHDFVRLETRVALEREIRVVPVLVGGALMPRTEELPDELKSLARRQAIEISHKQWDGSTRELIRALNIMLGQRSDTGITVPGDVPVAQTLHSQAGVAPDALGSPAPGGGSSRRWMVVAGLVAGVLGVALWAGRSESPEPAPAASSTPTLTAEAPPGPGKAAAPATAPAAVPSPTPPPVAAVAPPAPPTPSPPVIRLFQSQGDPAGAKLCYSVALAESVTLTPQLGALAKPVKDCVTVAVAEPTTFTLTARNAHGSVTRTLSVRPRPAVVVPAPDPVAIAPTPAPAPVPAVAPKADSLLPRAGESWTYRTSGKWPTSPRREIVIAVESVRDGVVTDTLQADAQERTVGDTRRLLGSRPGFMAWQQIGLEYSPYLGAFRDLSSLGPLSNFATPDMDTWGQWYSEAKVVGRETVNVPGGSFDAFKVEVWSSRSATGGSTLAPIEPVRIQYLVWYAPNVKRYVKMQRRVLSAGHREIEKDVFELVAHR